MANRQMAMQSTESCGSPHKRLNFKTINSAVSMSANESLQKLYSHLIINHMSEYNREMVQKVVRMLIRKYNIPEPDEDFGKRVFADMVEARKSANYVKNVMRSIELWAASQGKTFKLPRPEKYNGRIDYLTPEDARRLIGAAANVRDRAMLAVFLWGGVRLREAIHANVEDYDANARMFWIRHNVDADIRYPGIKNKREETVTLSKEAAKYLSEYLGERPVVQTRAMFITRDGRRFSVRGVDDMIRRTAKRAGISKNVGAHLLRHTMVTLACATNTNLFFVQKQARHSSPVITEKYAHAAADFKILQKAFDEAAKTMF